MLKIYCFVSLFFLCNVVWSQQTPIEIPLNSSTIFKNAQGEIISFDDFMTLTSGSGHEMNPVFDENNALKEVIVVKSSIAQARNTLNPAEFANTKELIDNIPPDFQGEDIYGKFYDTENLAGKVVVLKFWFQACKPCLDEIPELNQLVAQYRDNSEVVFLAPSLDRKASILSFLQRMPFHYSIIPDARKIAHNYNVPGYPTHVVINRFGKVNTVYLGVNYKIKDKLSRAIDFALTQTTPPVIESPEESIPQSAPEEELFISPASVIKDEAGNLVPFEKFVAMMNSGKEYQLLAQKEEGGKEFVLIKAVEE